MNETEKYVAIAPDGKTQDFDAPVGLTQAELQRFAVRNVGLLGLIEGRFEVRPVENGS